MSTIRANTVTDAAGTGAPTLTNGAVLPAGSAAAPAISPTGDSNTGVFFPAADTVAVTTGGTERMRINSSGNVGINTSTPSKKLEVYAASASLQINSIVKNDNSAAGVAAIGFNVSSSASGEATSTKAGIGLQRNFAFGGGFLCFYNNNSGAAGDFTTADERMRIDGSGNLLFNSGYGSVATAYGCRAWVKFGGAGTISGSGNVTSVTNPSTGRYVVSFTTAMPDANYAVSTGGTVVDSTGNPWQAWGNISRGYGTGSFTIDCSAQGTTGAGQSNWAIVTVAVFR